MVWVAAFNCRSTVMLVALDYLFKRNPLIGHWIQLEPFDEVHREELRVAADDKRIWTYNATKAFGAQFDGWFDEALENFQRKQHLPFAVRRRKDNAIIGSTRYYGIFTEHLRLSIGYTWYCLDTWGTEVNPECKYLLLQHAFEAQEVNRVEFFADSRNLRSQAAIKKLGAIQEGVLRQHMVVEDNYIRDTVVFGIVNSEWPAI